MAASVRELAESVRGRVVGDPEASIHAARPVTEAGPGDLTFLADDRYLGMLAASTASAVLIGSDFTIPEEDQRLSTMTFIVVDDPRAAFMAIHAALRGAGAARRFGIDPLAVVSPRAKVGHEVAIGPFATVGDDAVIGNGCTVGAGSHVGPRSRLGDKVTLHPNVTIYEDVAIGERCTVHAGSVIGADGFGYQMVDGRHVKVPQNGGVVIEADVEIGANSCVDRGTFGPTRIGAGTKIDNLVQVGHNASIGKHSILCAGVGIGGSVVSGDYVMMGGQSGVRDHMTIGDGAQLGAQSGVTRSLGAGVAVFGTPAVPVRLQLQMHAASMRLPEMRRQLKALAEEVRRLSEAADVADADDSAPEAEANAA